MPPRRRGNLTSAAALPASRLPLGTPTNFTFQTSPDLASTSSRSPLLLKTHHSDLSFGDSDLGSAIDQESYASNNSFVMSANKATFDAPAKSIAEAKLERQRKRIEEAEASLNAAPQLDRRAQSSRGKNTKWKPFDYSADAPPSRGSADGGVPVTEVRVNTFRAPSRASSIHRPGSVLSHRTSETYASDIERNDLSVLDSGGFQLYQSKKSRKHLADLNAYEDKPEQRQTTVEAAFDKREIYEVFGNALPSRDFIDENPGVKNGQLQFVQHPNGDVSAHQWSTERYIWENIGQFSNIRKKVEGQLAADRLKGETALQAMQQNTLAYFRIIAKQREATVMGSTLGTKDIQAALSDPARLPSAAPTGLKEQADDRESVQSSPAKVAVTHEERRDSQHSVIDVTALPSIVGPSQVAQHVPQALRTPYPNLTPHVNVKGHRRDDPFLSTAQYYPMYGTQPYMQQYQSQMTNNRSYNSAAFRSHGLNYGFNYPSQPAAAPAAINNFTQTSITGTYQARLPQQTSGAQMGFGSQHTTPQYRPLLNSQPPSAASNNTVTQANINVSTPPQRQYEASPNPRTAARDQLWKLPETAKERSISQGNVRTVLFDPFQSQTTPAKQKEEEVLSIKKDATLDFGRHESGKVLQPPASFSHTPSKFFPTGLTPQLQKPPSPAGSSTTNKLLDSSPDPPPRRVSHPPTISTITATPASKGTPLNLQAAFEKMKLKSSDPASSAAATMDDKAHLKQLHDWYTSGNTFARQEDFYRSLQRAQPSSTTASTDTPPFARLLIPVIENLASYIQGPASQRHDYFCPWTKPPEWAIDNSENGNNSFFDKEWGTPPARVGRDPRYSGTRGWSVGGQMSGGTPGMGRGRRRGESGAFGGGYVGGSPGGYSVVGGIGVDRRFGRGF